jgi:hypothetical protein
MVPFCTSRRFKWQIICGLLVSSFIAPTLAHAQEDLATPVAPRDVSAAESAGAGAFSSFSIAARSDTQRTLARVVGGYEGASDKALFDTALEARIMERIALRAGGSYLPASDGFGLRFGGKVDALRQETSGIDLAIAGGYEATGFNEVAAVGGQLALGKSFGRLLLLANAGYARGLEQTEEHYASAGAAAHYRVTSNVQLGVDSRFRIDLERDDDEPPGEREWDLLLGPQITVAVGPVAVSGGAGLSAQRLRLENDTKVGTLGQLGVGAAF